MNSFYPENFPLKAKIAFQGVAGAYSHIAIEKSLGDAYPISMPCTDFSDVFACVNTDIADFGMLPVENALTGSIHDNFDLSVGYGYSNIDLFKDLRGRNIKSFGLNNYLPAPGMQLINITLHYNYNQN